MEERCLDIVRCVCYNGCVRYKIFGVITMKRYIAAILAALFLLFGLCACEGNRDDSSEEETTKKTEAQEDDDAPLQTEDKDSEDDDGWIPKFY